MKEKEFAKDMLQESLTKIFKNIDTFDSDKASLYTWMSTITVRTCLRKLEKKSLEVIHLDDNENELGFTPEVLDRLEVQDLIDLVNLLPSGYKEVFNLNVIDGFSHKEISNLLEISEVASRSRLKRAKSLLKKYIHNIEIERSWKNII
jgi:RNA polymerase sigma-70 factor (ECF subfamily)